MRSGRIFFISHTIFVCILLFSCSAEEVILHGDITGYVTDAQTLQPMNNTLIRLHPVNDSVTSGIDGKYLFSNISSGTYEVEATAPAYETKTKNVSLYPAQTAEVNFNLAMIPFPELSENILEFGFDSTSMSFTIRNSGSGTLKYFLTPSINWVGVYPAFGEITTETDTVKVIVNRTGLTETTVKESILAIFITGINIEQVKVGVNLNRVMDSDSNYYDVVKIGNQMWMAENLNVGTCMSNLENQSDNGITEKYCYEDVSVYGGLYEWEEAMQYGPSDDKPIGTTRGICPTGWHIPTVTEWSTLEGFLGDDNGGKMKETGYSHWNPPNTGATNESGFTALPAGIKDSDGTFSALGNWTAWWSSTYPPDQFSAFHVALYTTWTYVSIQTGFGRFAISVRCVKDPVKK